MTRRVHLRSLGCPKNRVDSEVMVGKLMAGAFELTDDPAEAEVIVVNTCSFIQPATDESLQTVLEMAGFKDAGSCKQLIVTGCMVQRYGTDLEKELPEVDAFLGTGEYHRIVEVIERAKGSGPRSHVDIPMYIHDEFAARVPSSSRHSAYLKISEGCDHRCAFCIIPTLRGKLRSRSVPSLVAEAQGLARAGVVELNLVSQDTTAYGRDREDGSDLGGLLRGLARVDGLRWIRVHYLYPYGVSAEALRAIAEEPNICKYIDIPLQHASGPMLKAMRRAVTRSAQERVLERIRKMVPDAVLRTTFIVGFPGETERDFEELQDFVRAQRFDRVGVFTYSPEEGTDAHRMKGQVPDDVKEARRASLMQIQSEISSAKLEALVGKELDVLVDGPSEEHELAWVGRLASQAPDIDGQVFLDEVPSDVRPGQFLKVRIRHATEYDLVGQVLKGGGDDGTRIHGNVGLGLQRAGGQQGHDRQQH